MPSNVEKIERFVRGEIEFVPAACRFQLHITSIEGVDQMIVAINVPDGEPLDVTVEKITGMIFAKAKSMAEESDRLLQFNIFSFERRKSRLKKDGTARIRRNMERFSVPGGLRQTMMNRASMPGEIGEGISVSEPPTPQGVLGLLMRHNDEKDRKNTQLVEMILEHTLAENRRLSADNAVLHRQSAEVRAEREAIMSEAAQRNMDMTKFQNDEARKKMAFEMLATQLFPKLAEYLPGIMESIMGKAPALPAEASAADEKLKKLQIAFLAFDEDTRNEIGAKLFEKNPAVAKQLFDLLL